MCVYVCVEGGVEYACRSPLLPLDGEVEHHYFSINVKEEEHWVGVWQRKDRDRWGEEEQQRIRIEAK